MGGFHWRLVDQQTGYYTNLGNEGHSYEGHSGICARFLFFCKEFSPMRKSIQATEVGREVASTCSISLFNKCGINISLSKY